MADFVNDFISDCLENGITKMPDVCKKALQRRDEIDLELQKIYDLKEERDNLQKVLKALNHDEAKRGRKSKAPPVNEIDTSDKSNTFILLLKDICSFVEKVSRPLTSREIIVSVGYDGLDPTPVYYGIKYLAERNVLGRNDRDIIKGSNWDDRENHLNNSTS
jgi:hypothetical protein